MFVLPQCFLTKRREIALRIWEFYNDTEIADFSIRYILQKVHQDPAKVSRLQTNVLIQPKSCPRSVEL